MVKMLRKDKFDRSNLFLSHLHSFRTNQLSSLVMKENESLIIEAKVESNKQNEHLKVVVSHHKSIYFVFESGQ